MFKTVTVNIGVDGVTVAACASLACTVVRQIGEMVYVGAIYQLQKELSISCAPPLARAGGGGPAVFHLSPGTASRRPSGG